jgi:hypothetical protein
MLAGRSIQELQLNDLRRIVVTVLLSAGTSAAVCLLLAPSPPAPPPRVEPDVNRLDCLEEKIELLERAPAAVPAAVPIPDAPQRAEVVRVDHGPELMRRIDGLEARLFRLELLGSASSAEHQDPRLAFAAGKDEATRTLLDPAADVTAKLKAHEALRSVPDAYTPAMVAELLRIGTTHHDGGVRAQVWLNFDGRSKLPAIVAPLVRALQADTDARAREEAADTLGSYLDDPIVEPALKQAAQGDASEQVRAKAARTLKARRSFPQLAGEVPR